VHKHYSLETEECDDSGVNKKRMVKVCFCATKEWSTETSNSSNSTLRRLRTASGKIAGAGALI